MDVQGLVQQRGSARLAAPHREQAELVQRPRDALAEPDLLGEFPAARQRGRGGLVLAPVHGCHAQVQFRARRALRVAEFGEHRERLGAFGRRGGEVTLQPRGESQRIAGAGHARAVAERFELGERLRLQFPGPGVPALLPGDAAQRRQNPGDAPPVAEFAVERKRALQPAYRRRVLALQVGEHAAALQPLGAQCAGRQHLG